MKIRAPMQLRMVWLVVRKDLLLESRSGETIITASSFALLMLTVFAITLRVPPDVSQTIAPIVLWTGISFASILAMLRSYSNESSESALEMVLLAPVGHEVLTLGKALSNFLLLGGVTLVMLVFATFILNVNFLRWEVVVTALMINLGFGLAGSLFGALTLRSRERGILIVLLFTPFVVPLIQAGVATTSQFIGGQTIADNWGWMALIAASDIAYALALVIFSSLLFED